MRSGSILPFTSACGVLSGAATAAVVELLPLVHTVQLQALLCAAFPTLASIIATAASVSKVRCEVDAAAVIQAASRIAEVSQTEVTEPGFRRGEVSQTEVTEP